METKLPSLRRNCGLPFGWLTEAIRIGPLVAKTACTVNAAFQDEPENDIDVYRLRAAQTNGQWAWLTPIWVER